MIKAKHHKLMNKVTGKRVNMTSIEYAQKHLALTKVDKAANTLAWECIYYHQNNLWERATNGENFIMSTFTLTEAKHHLVETVKSHTRLWLKPELIPTALAYLTSTIKFHKEPIAYRHITPMHNCPLAPITKLLGAALQYLLKNTWRDLCYQGELYILRTHGVQARLNWRVESMNDFMLNLPINVSSLWGCDIDQCYEKPPLLTGDDSLYESVKWFASECYRHEASTKGCTQHLWFKTTQGHTVKDKFINILGFSHDPPSGRNVHKLRFDYLLRLTHVALNNILFQVGDTIFKQVIGFPMGVHPGGAFCDIYFGCREYKFIYRCLAMGDLTTVCNLKEASRYQDDVTILNYPNARDHFNPANDSKCIYPMQIVAIKDTTSKYTTVNNIAIGTELSFLSCLMTLIYANGVPHLHTKRYEKVRELPFDTVKFTHRTSCVPESSLYNVIGAHLTSTAMICSHLCYFLEEIRILCKHLTNNALSTNRIIKTIERWANTTAPTLPLCFDTTNLPEFVPSTLHPFG